MKTSIGKETILSERTLRRLADVGMIGPIVFGITIIILTFLEYDFITRIGWDPLQESDVAWPSGLALGPYGWLQVANFVLFGVCLIALAFGLHRGVRAGGRGSWVGPALLVVAGVALVLSGFKTDPNISEPPQTWHGEIHVLAFLLLIFSLLPSFFVLWRRLRRDPLWRGYGRYTLVSGVLYTILFLISFMGPFIPELVAFYLFLGVILAWIEVMALHLRSIATGASAERVAPAG